MIKLIDTVAVKNELGEGVIWDHHRQKVWWTDILQSKLYQYDPKTKALKSWSTPERLCCFAPVSDSSDLVCAFESGFAFYEPQSGKINWIKRLEQDNPGTRFNDGRTDRQGRLWAGTMVENQSNATYKGSLYCLHADLTISKSITGLTITNSLCWSPNGKTVYHTDTPTRTIQAYDFDTDNARLSNRRDIVKTEDGCFPDGSAVDKDGFIWNAQWGGSKVVRYSASGEKDLEVDIPTSQPTCVAFGGHDLSLLFVTTAWSEMKKKERHAGNLFIFKTGFIGLSDTQFS
ncbi:MAG: SMP-30/gluconolactonase/LRE family protein [Gammaproteobacteria bacterium]|nr:SMP-30/gluconolactonase/LRE family protein [Gammaproteobacteria bacterium]